MPGTGPGSVVVGHASEIPYVFGARTIQLTPGEEAELSGQVSKYWANFAMYGDPNGAGAAAGAAESARRSDADVAYWPRYEQATDTVLVIDVPSAGTRSYIGRVSRSEKWVGSVYLGGLPFSHSTSCNNT